MPIQVWALRNSVETLLATVTDGFTASTSALGSDVTQIRVYDFTGFARGPLLATLAASSPSTGGGSSFGSASTSAPAPIVQQFGKPVIGTCAAAAPELLNWSGVANGGWGESWAQWINAGSGGAVCSRTLVYSNAQGRWMVG